MNKKVITIKQKSTWLGIALMLFGGYHSVFTGDLEQAGMSLMTGLGLLFADEVPKE